MLDVNFPVIEYRRQDSPLARGRQHGESWREAIRELVAIRLGLMLEKNPRLGPSNIPELARQQWQATQEYSRPLTEELKGIAEGAGITTEQLVVLNNYTDFRDIVIDDQGCSAIFVRNGGPPVAGQTWDMHGSAKRFVCCLEIPDEVGDGSAVAFSIVGCLGMMGFHSGGRIVGVNNINTSGARPGILWPALIRSLMGEPVMERQAGLLREASLTSGRSFLVGDRNEASFWEVMPGLCERVSHLPAGQAGWLFHTNHCLGPLARERETPLSLTSTTHIRHALLERKIGMVRDFDDAWALLNDHENYPQSICSNYQTNSQDPSITCGGAVGDLESGKVRMWRGDSEYDDNYILREFQLQ